MRRRIAAVLAVLLLLAWTLLVLMNYRMWAALKADPLYIGLSRWGRLLTVLFGAGGLLAVPAYLALAGRGRGSARRVSGADPLTRLLPAADLEPAMREFFRKNQMKDYSLISMDLVSFRRFNSMFGAEAGDELLRLVGECIRRDHHCAVRVSADTFMFVARSSVRLTVGIEHSLREQLRQGLGERQLQMVGFKFGVYPLLADSLEFREAYDGALLALKHAKNQPKRAEVVYDRKMQRTARMQKDIEANMAAALAAGEFVMYVQPKFRTADGSCCGGEVLVRWQSSQMGFLTPFHFIPLFEQNGFVAELDLYMLEQLLGRLQRQIDAGKRPLPLSINMSRVTIAFPNYLSRVEELVRRYTVPLGCVEIEITESALTDNREAVISLVGELQKMGFTVAMDDFGTGYSSLSTLRELRVDVLKLDKEFLRESESERGKKIIQSILSMARELEIQTVCEGVETGMQLDFLQKAECDAIQGYLMAKPVPYQEYEQQFSR